MVFALLTTEKHFRHRWIGDPALNRYGVHPMRMRAARWCANLRRAQVYSGQDPWVRTLREDGVVALENFLPEATFAALREEARAALAASEREAPIQANEAKGFGAKQEHAWGFDRFDGGTLNRYIIVRDPGMPALREFTHDPRLSSFARMVVSCAQPARLIWIYAMIHGDEGCNPDIQKDLHRDTFFPSFKFWYFLEPVGPRDGPFVYVRGSHRLTPARMAWEQMRALAACRARMIGRDAAPAKDLDAMGGSFRIDESELAQLDLPPPSAFEVAANTLVMADTLGFHRRGDAAAGSRRLAVYGNRRPWPFGLIGT